MYFPKYFELHELVPQAFYPKNSELNDKIKAWHLLDDRILRTADSLRERYGKMIINDWWWRSESKGGIWVKIKGNQYRGWRPPNCEVGAIMSQHKFGRALDLTPLEVTVDEIRTDLLRYETRTDQFKHIRAMELEVPHLHIDCRNWYNDRLHLIYP